MAKSKKAKKPVPANTFGIRVRAIRKKLKMRQEDFAPGLEISSNHLCEIEKGKSKPCHDFFFNIVKNYNVNLYYLLFGEGEMFVGRSEAIVTDGKKIKTGDKHIDEFLYYFFKSSLVQRYVMYQFRKFYIDEKASIKKDLESSEEEDYK
jgi:transcriptional regulator with XRE-family HTH domain